jgi:DNA-binding XRE family transcriptional regulator
MLMAMCFSSKFVNKLLNVIIMSKEPILLLFGANVQKYRKKLGLSQEQLAEIAGVHRTYIGMVERAEKNITLCNIEKIAKALKVQIQELFQK